VEAMGPVIVVVGMLLAGAFAYWTWLQKQKRREALALWASQRGMSFTHHDPYGLDDLGFHLFTLGDGRGVENVVAGTWEGLPVRIADYWYYDESTDSEGRRSRTYQHWSIVLTEVAASLPAVRIEKENPLTRLADKLGFKDIDFESEEFNRRFQVKSPDREFAFKLLDARMLQWLLHTAGGHNYEVAGPWLLTYSRRVGAPDGLTPLLYAAKGFVEQIPRLVWADYGTNGKVVP
jgi:hypothetical protein